MADPKNAPIFTEISPEQNVVEIESLCMQCHEKVQKVVAAFECPFCGFRNNSIQSAAAIADKGVKQSCLVSCIDDLNRQVVVSEHAKIMIEDINLEMPPTRDKGFLNTIEGVISHIVSDLREGQEFRKSEDHDSYEKLNLIISKLDSILEGTQKCVFTLDDPSGNSYIEDLYKPFPVALTSSYTPKPDPRLKCFSYKQTPEQLLEMGFQVDNPSDEQSEQPDSVYCFPSNCSSCGSPCETRMHLIEIPHFREVIIMATTCDVCGYKSNEVKSGGAVSELGKRIELKVTCEEDLNRDILKSETCTLEIPEIDLHLTTGALGGKFTTIEGLLRQVHDELQSKIPFITGDSVQSEKRERFAEILSKIRGIYETCQPCTLILDDPLGNSYLQNIFAPDEDPNMKISHYKRSFEQDEEFGLNDIKVDNYQ